MIGDRRIGSELSPLGSHDTLIWVCWYEFFYTSSLIRVFLYEFAYTRATRCSANGTVHLGDCFIYIAVVTSEEERCTTGTYFRIVISWQYGLNVSRRTIAGDLLDYNAQTRCCRVYRIRSIDTRYSCERERHSWLGRPLTCPVCVAENGVYVFIQ